jgi:FkbM family methyltransferase
MEDSDAEGRGHGGSIQMNNETKPAPTMKSRLVDLAFTLARLYLRHGPTVGKRAAWRQVIRPRLAWRSFEIEARSRSGLRFLGSTFDLIHSRMYFFGFWEPAITDYLRRALRPGDIVVDVGANVGAHSLLAAQLVGSTGRVHSVEASPSILGLLQRNIRLNGIAHVIVHHVAVMDRHGEVTVFKHGADNIGGTTVLATEGAARAASAEATVPARPLGEIVPLEDLLRARLIKIDVEGAEAMVVRGLRDLLPRFGARTEFLVEVNLDSLAAAGSSIEEFTGWFADAGFEVLEIPNDYDIEAYLDPPDATPTVFRPDGRRQYDLLFRRPAAPATRRS